MSKKNRRKKTKKNKLKRSFQKIRRKVKRSLKKSFKKTLEKIKSKVVINKRLKKQYNIKDVPLDKKPNKGTKASSNFVDYHYQRLDNIINFIKLETKQRNDIHYSKPPENSFLEVNIVTNKIKPLYTSLEEFINVIQESKNKKHLPITVNIQLPTHSHANIILIDNELKNVEYFEPHGYKKEESTLEGIPNAYHNKLKMLRKFFSEVLPDYQFINASDYFKREGFQMKHDARHGYCVTWSVLYLHYRLLNPNLEIDKLIRYLYYHITLSKLLRYARYIEKVLKLQ